MLCFIILALLASSTYSQSVQGIWYWTWSSSASVSGKTLSVAFSGWVDADQALSDSSSIYPKLVGQKYLSIGGGNGNGHFTAASLSKVSTYCGNGKFNGYQGIAFDIEEGDSGLSSAFANAFSACKSAGFKVLITTSHSAPYGIGDASTLMQSFFQNANNIDYMSPQLYSSGTEGSNDYTTGSGVTWAQYKPFSGKLIPSVVAASYYWDSQSYFGNLGITTVGYVQWSQTAASNPSVPPVTPPPSNPSNPPSNPPSSGTGSAIRCGSDWSTANTACGRSCTTDADCTNGNRCYASLDMTPCAGSGSNSKPANLPSTRCGASWVAANGLCSNQCAVDGDCSAGLKCFANLDTTPCASRALAGDANSFQESTYSENSVTPALVAFIVTACVLTVTLLVVVVVFMATPRKTESV
jgi:hypothetical protein